MPSSPMLRAKTLAEDAQVNCGLEVRMASRAVQRYQDIARQVHHIAQAYAGEALNIQLLCKTIGVNERTLRVAFQCVHGKTPYRHLREQRMAAAREALLHPMPARTTVTSVATQFGFPELGRFSVEYRKAFGECPSATLRRTSRAALPGYGG